MRHKFTNSSSWCNISSSTEGLDKYLFAKYTDLHSVLILPSYYQNIQVQHHQHINTTNRTLIFTCSAVILDDESSEPRHPVSRGHHKVPVGLRLVLHEVSEGTEDGSRTDRSSWNTAGVDLLHLRIVLNGLVDDLRVFRVILKRNGYSSFSCAKWITWKAWSERTGALI